MPARESKALRSVVADLAHLRDDDVEAILADLDAPSRNRLADLLNAYRKGDAGDGASALTPALDIAPWLSDRLAAAQQGQHGGMTAHAVQALQRIAADQGWSGSPVEARRPAQRGLIDRMVWRS